MNSRLSNSQGCAASVSHVMTTHSGKWCQGLILGHVLYSRVGCLEEIANQRCSSIRHVQSGAASHERSCQNGSSLAYHHQELRLNGAPLILSQHECVLEDDDNPFCLVLLPWQLLVTGPTGLSHRLWVDRYALAHDPISVSIEEHL